MSSTDVFVWYFINLSLSSSVLSVFLHLQSVFCSFLHFCCFLTHSILSIVHLLPVHPQAFLVRALLEYSQTSESSVPYGLSLVAGIFVMELMRSWTLALMWAVNYRTAARLRGAALTFAFNKILGLRSTKDIGPGEVSVKTLEGTRLQINKIIPHCGAPHADD